jgi:dolichol-phosphate mannosyltransferase
MDADFSHHPAALPEMMSKLERAEFVIGSRYTTGGRSEQTLSRVILSRGANGLTRLLLGIPVREATTSYRGFRRSLLARLDIDAIKSEGYSFFVESIFQVSRHARQDGDTQPMVEFPICFADRRKGVTKISRLEIWRGMTTWRGSRRSASWAPRASAVSGWRNHPWLRREFWAAAAPKLATVLTFAITIRVFLRSTTP